MSLTIRNPEAEELAETLARLTGETKTEAVTKALRDRLVRLRRSRSRKPLADELDRIALHCSRLPVRDPRTPEAILGYNEHGPTLKELLLAETPRAEIPVPSRRRWRRRMPAANE